MKRKKNISILVYTILLQTILILAGCRYLFPIRIELDDLANYGYFECSAVDSNDNIYVGGYPSFSPGGGGIFTSTDNGNSWIQLITTDAHIFALTVTESGHIYAGTYSNGVYKSTDMGKTWIRTVGALTGANCLINTATGNIICGGIYSSGFLDFHGNGVLIYYENLDLWMQTSLKNKGIYSLATNSNGDIFAGSDGGRFYKSTDNGNNWTQTELPDTSKGIHSLAINSKEYIFAGTYGEGAFRSTDNGDNWHKIENGLDADQFLAFAINAQGYIFAGTDGDGVYRSTDNGNSWTETNNGLNSSHITSLSINSKGYVFATTRSDGVYRSTNNGDSWSEINYVIAKEKYLEF